MIPLGIHKVISILLQQESQHGPNMDPIFRRWNEKIRQQNVKDTRKHQQYKTKVNFKMPRAKALSGAFFISTHWGQVTHICISKLNIIVSDNGLSPGRRQAIIWTNGGILLIGFQGTNFNEILIEIHTFSFKIMHFKMSSGKWQPFLLEQYRDSHIR